MIRSGTFVRLDTARHDRQGFDCGEPELNRFLREQAAKHERQEISRTWVLPDPDGTPDASGRAPIVAFFTLAYTAVDREDLPPEAAKRLPRWPIPVFLIGQLAVARAFRGQGLGSATLGVALRRLVAVQDEQVPAHAVVVDCLDESVVAFYAERGFSPMNAPGPRPRMFLPMKTARRVVADR